MLKTSYKGHLDQRLHGRRICHLGRGREEVGSVELPPLPTRRWIHEVILWRLQKRTKVRRIHRMGGNTIWSSIIEPFVLREMMAPVSKLRFVRVSPGPPVPECLTHLPS